MQENIIIAASEAQSHRDARVPSTWQQQLTHAIRDPQILCERLGLSRDWLAGARIGHDLFDVCVPEAYLTRIAHADINDPLLRQVMPLSEEALTPQGYVVDPLEEADHRPAKGLIHKYAGRVLLIASPNCAINCRYCFRRNYPYQQAVGRERLDAIVDTLKNDLEITEVILSGGDPLSLTDRQLNKLIVRLDAISHLKRLRIHTRIPLTIPQRLDTDLACMLRDSRLDVALVIHANHANEIDDAVSLRLQELHRHGIVLLNQSVLLRNINDSAEALIALSERLFSASVLPYYVHLLDRVAGAAHFDVPLSSAHALEDELTRCLPGYLVPKFVREVPGEQAKSTIHRL